MDTRIAENIFKRSDFSKESDLMVRLGKELFPVRNKTLDQLMEEEGIRTRGGIKNEAGRERTRTRHAEREKAPESLGVIERDNPLIKKNKPPLL